MQALIVSSIGGTRRQLENWLKELGLRVLVAESFDRAVNILGENSRIALVVSDWELSAYTAYDLYKKSSQFTRVTDAEEVQHRLDFLILVTPGVRNSRHTEQIEVLRSIQQVRMLEKPINRHQLQAELHSLSCGLEKSLELQNAGQTAHGTAQVLASGEAHRSPSEHREKTQLILRSLGACLLDMQAKFQELQQLVSSS